MQRYLVLFPKEWAPDSNSARNLTITKLTKSGFMYNIETNAFGGIADSFSIGGDFSGWLTYNQLGGDIRDLIHNVPSEILKVYAETDRDKIERLITSGFNNKVIDPKTNQEYMSCYDEQGEDEGEERYFYVPKEKLRTIQEDNWRKNAPKILCKFKYPEPQQRANWYNVPYNGHEDDAQIINRPMWSAYIRGNKGSWRTSSMIVLDKKCVDESFINNYWAVIVAYEPVQNSNR